MTTWNSTAPDGTRSVKANKQILLDNTQYTEAKMGNTANDTTNTDAIRDHFWKVDANFDGRHRFINFPAFTIAGAATDPVIGASMQGVLYLKEDSISSSNEIFFRNAAGVKQLTSNLSSLGASGYITTITGAPTLSKVYNITAVVLVTTGTIRFDFTENMADTNYIVQVTLGDGGAVSVGIPEATKLVSSVTALTFNNDGVAASPTSMYITVYA